MGFLWAMLVSGRVSCFHWLLVTNPSAKKVCELEEFSFMMQVFYRRKYPSLEYPSLLIGTESSHVSWHIDPVIALFPNSPFELIFWIFFMWAPQEV